MEDFHHHSVETAVHILSLSRPLSVRVQPRPVPPPDPAPVPRDPQPCGRLAQDLRDPPSRLICSLHRSAEHPRNRKRIFNKASSFPFIFISLRSRSPLKKQLTPVKLIQMVTSLKTCKTIHLCWVWFSQFNGFSMPTCNNKHFNLGFATL